MCLCDGGGLGSIMFMQVMVDTKAVGGWGVVLVLAYTGVSVQYLHVCVWVHIPSMGRQRHILVDFGWSWQMAGVW